MRRLPDCSAPLVYLITEGTTTNSSLAALIEYIERTVAAGVDMVQIREPDLTARALTRLCDGAAKLALGSGTRILVNDRADIGACAADGVHLTTRSMTAEVVRNAFRSDLLIGASTHTNAEAEAAERGGADFVVFGPVFPTPSKKQYGDPVGLAALASVARRLTIPVLALGGVNLSNFRDALDAGAAGIAGISMFAETDDLRGLVQAIKLGASGCVR